LLQHVTETDEHRWETIDGASSEHLEIIKSLEQHDRIAYVYHMNRHLQARLQLITPKAV
jgi:DNA-binding GntR family transcriptional regulator